jgi:hypothetical protein
MWKRKRRARRASEVVQARRFEVLDEGGHVRVVLGQTGSGRAGVEAIGLELCEPGGSPRLAVLLTEFGPSVTVMAAGNVVAAFGHDDPHAEVIGSGAFLQLMTSEGAPAVLWRVLSDGLVHDERPSPG